MDKMVFFLASDDSSWLTGETIDINGEQFMDWRAANPSGFHWPTHPESRECQCRLVQK